MKPMSGENAPVMRSSRSHSCRGVSVHDGQSRDCARSCSACGCPTARSTSVPPYGGVSLFARLSVVATAEIFLQPDVQNDEEVSAPHLFELQFRFPGSPISPRDRN